MFSVTRIPKRLKNTTYFSLEHGDEMEIDLAEITPAKTSIGRGIALLIDSKNVTVFTPRSEKWGGGRESENLSQPLYVT